MGLVEDFLPEVSAQQRYAGLLAGLQQASAFGITAYIEPGVSEDNIRYTATRSDAAN